MSPESPRHNIIDSEFRPIFENNTFGEKIDPNISAVVVLSGHGLYDKDGKPVTWVSPENTVRIGYGIEIIRELAKIKYKKDSVSRKELCSSGVKLILNGESEKQDDRMRNQLIDMKKIAQAYNFPEDLIVLEDCLEDGTGNTKTQFDAINNDHNVPKNAHIAIVTSDYHAPRVARTAEKNLRNDIFCQVIPAPQNKYAPRNMFSIVMGEVRRIAHYSKKGDISQALQNVTYART